jgi:ABC-2 type transport system permease protein
MKTIKAIFIKQMQDMMKNMGVLVQFVIFPAMAFLMTRVIDMPYVPGMFTMNFVGMFAEMFVGMTLIGTAATIIAEDREKKSLRFLMMAGVKPHQYLLGIGGVLLACSLVVSGIFTFLLEGATMNERLIYLASLMLGAIASILLGALIGMVAKNEQSAISLGTSAGMTLGFAPMIVNLSGNETIQRFLSIFYTMNFVSDDFQLDAVMQNMGIVLANVVILAIAFAVIYKKQGLGEGETTPKTRNKMRMQKA